MKACSTVNAADAAPAIETTGVRWPDVDADVDAIDMVVLLGMRMKPQGAPRPGWAMTPLRGELTKSCAAAFKTRALLSMSDD
jgi:hypothetical protein